MIAAHRRFVAAVVLAVAGLLLGIGAAPAAAAADTAYVRLALLSPDTPPVDAYVDAVTDPEASFTVPGLEYGVVVDYRPLAPGSYVISMRAAGAPADSPPMISTTVEAGPGGTYTIAGTGLRSELGLTVLDDSAGTPPAGQASVRVINAAAGAPAVDVAPAGQAAWASGVQFARATGYGDSPPGDWRVTVSASGQLAATQPVTLEAASSYTVVLVDRNGGVLAQLHRDRAGAGVAPQGGVGTGGAAQGGIGVAVALAVLVTALVGGLLVRRAARRGADR